MRHRNYILIVIVAIFLLLISACGLIKEDPIGSLLQQATVVGTMARATPEPGSEVATIEPSGVNPSKVIFQDDFSDPSTGWDVYEDEYGHSDYADGGYLVEAYKPGEYFWGSAYRYFDNIRIDVDVKMLETNNIQNDGYGVDCRIQDNGDGYGFRISSDGYIAIIIFIDQSGSPLIDWELNEAVFTDGRTNHLTAICEGNQLTFLVNEIQVAQVTDDTYSDGDITLSAITFEDQPVKVLFDNLYVQSIGDTLVEQETGNYSVTIDNPTTHEACYLFITSPDEEFWGESYLDPGDVLQSGGSLTINDLPNRFIDIRVENCQNVLLFQEYGIDLSSETSIQLLEPELLYHQPFDSLDGWTSGVVEGGMIEHSQSDYYSISVIEADQLVQGTGDFWGDDVMLQADASLVKTGENNLGMYGVTCRVQEDGSGIFFAVRGDGMAAIIKMQGQEMIELTDWQTTDWVNAGIASNYIEGDCFGSTFSLYVNGDYLGSVEDGEFSEGLVGVAVFSPSGQTTRADFDYLDVYAPY